MSEQTLESGLGGQDAEPARSAESREQVRRQVQAAVERAAREGGRAAVIMLEVNPNYAKRARERVLKALAEWQRRRPERVELGVLGATRFALAIALNGQPAQARSLAERLTRSLDPRLCPLLRRALPYAWSGVSLYPDDGFDADILIARAEQAVERNRASTNPRRQLVLSRRRAPAATLLRPAVVR